MVGANHVGEFIRRYSPGDRRGPSPGDRRGPMVRANHVGEFIRRYSPGDRRGPSPGDRHGPSPGDRRDPSPGDRRGPMVRANHSGEFIRRYSPIGLGHATIKKPSPMAVGEGCAGGVMAGESLPWAGIPQEDGLGLERD